MAYEVVNKLKGKSTIRCVDAGTYTIALTDLRANANIETVTAATIAGVAWSTSGYISITRNSVPQMNLMGSGQWTNMEGIIPSAGANNKTQSLVIVVSGGGTIVLDVTKTFTINADVQRVLIDG